MNQPKSKILRLPESAIKAELWRRGELDWKLRPVQRRISAAWEATKLFSKTFVCHVSRRLGKTYLWNEKAIQLGLKKPKAKTIFIAPVKEKLQDFITPIINTIIVDAPKEYCPVLSGTNLNFYNSSVVNYYGSVNTSYKHIRGADADLVIIEEAGFHDYLAEILGMVKPVLLRSGGHLVMSSSSPVTPDHPFAECIQEAILGGYYFKATVDEDETLTPDQIQTLEKEMGGRQSTAFRREMLCELVTETERAIIPEWRDDFVKELEPNQYWPLYHCYAAMDI